ncbi:hypothetical protein A2U01_0098714 [Trifolium medium]|nr:hypothetical protein [Trifolium medium]
MQLHAKPRRLPCHRYHPPSTATLPNSPPRQCSENLDSGKLAKLLRPEPTCLETPSLWKGQNDHSRSHCCSKHEYS